MLKNKNIMFLFLINLIVGILLRFYSQDFPWLMVSDLLLISVFLLSLYLNYNLRHHEFFGYKNPGFWLVTVVALGGIGYFVWSLLGL